MAKIYSSPEGIDEPLFDSENPKIFEKEIKNFVSKLKKHCVQNSNCEHAGEIATFAVDGGFASYMVYKYSQLIYIPNAGDLEISDDFAKSLRQDEIIKFIK